MIAAPPSLDERMARGQEAREATPRSSHSTWQPPADRADPVSLLEEQNQTREPDLVPVRHRRMMVSPFAFYRGTARIMAEDLKCTPTAGLIVQLCGDAHLSNFGVFASPERQLLFDLNDFDETLPGPFEYDVKRLAASLAIAARNNGFSDAKGRAAALQSVGSYRQAMAGFAQMNTMDVWYSRLDDNQILAAVRAAQAAEKNKAAKGKSKKARRKAADAKTAEKKLLRGREKVRTRTSLQALSKLAEVYNGSYRIVSAPPIVVPQRDWTTADGFDPEAISNAIDDHLSAYRASLRPDRRQLLDRFRMVDVARKVVGVGSVGTGAYIVLLQGRDAGDPLFLQVKEATYSVLEAHLRRSRYRQHGQRVVGGQRLMQSASDIYLGWSKAPETGSQFYWRQLRDMKGSVEVDSFTPAEMGGYAQACGWTLARAHARSGDPVAIATYLGTGDGFDQAVVKFATRYADQTERDYEEFLAAIRSGRLKAVEGV